MKLLHRLLPLVATLVVVSVAEAEAEAGEFKTRYYGPAKGDDVADLVTDAFAKRFPIARWELFLYSQAGMTDSGVRQCHGIAGVVPRDAGQFPQRSYFGNLLDSQPSPGAMTVGEEKQWAVSCARAAVKKMMSDDLNKVYAPFKP